MTTFILAIALLVALTWLGLEIGVASWNIRRASRYRRRESAADHAKERAVSERQDMAGRLTDLDKYAVDISWLLNFLYNRYDKFSDLEAEVLEGLKGVTGDTSIGEACDRYKDSKKALKLVRVTVRASDRIDTLMNSITQQLGQIMADFDQVMADFEDVGTVETETAPDKPASEESGETQSADSPASEVAAPNTKAPDGEVPQG